jgi:SAM-dependent methyltransferase
MEGSLKMTKKDEIAFLRKAGEGAIRHAAHKPFSDANCPRYLMAIGAVMRLLPPPPARLLDMGCGTGWTTAFFARRGYNVVGQDISPDMIRCARDNDLLDEMSVARFVVGDYEALPLRGVFDCVVFFDSLHHAEDERAALRAAYEALRPGGICVASEPGVGHARSRESIENVRCYGVHERDMPPRAVIRAGADAGFGTFRVFPHVDQAAGALYSAHPKAGHVPNLLSRSAKALFTTLFMHWRHGITVLVKPA